MTGDSLYLVKGNSETFYAVSYSVHISLTQLVGLSVCLSASLSDFLCLCLSLSLSLSVCLYVVWMLMSQFESWLHWSGAFGKSVDLKFIWGPQVNWVFVAPCWQRYVMCELVWMFELMLNLHQKTCPQVTGSINAELILFIMLQKWYRVSAWEGAGQEISSHQSQLWIQDHARCFLCWHCLTLPGLQEISRWLHPWVQIHRSVITAVQILFV